LPVVDPVVLAMAVVAVLAVFSNRQMLRSQTSPR
jgi:hypothetical protein